LKFAYSILILSIFAIAFISCVEPANETDVPGTYIYKLDADYDSIVINDDGTFHHNYPAYSNVWIVDTGTWRYVRDSDKSEIIFSRFRSFDRFYGYNFIDYYIDQKDLRMKVYKYSGTIRLQYDPDVYNYYKK
jgi:hypothetical protein